MKYVTTCKFGRCARILGASLIAAIVVPVIAFSQSPATVNLNSAANFTILAATAITSTGGGTIVGNIGINPQSAITGFPPGKVTGTIYKAGPITAQAQLDLTTAYNDAMGRTTNAITLSGNIGSQTLVPGLYKSTSSLSISSGDLTLDAKGDANAVWIFQIASTLTTTSGRQVILAGGAQAKNIFWAVGTSATLGTGSIFYGNILAHITITMNSTVTMVGRSLASTGAVTANGNGETNPDLVASSEPVFSTASRNITVNPARVDSISWTLITISNIGTASLVISASTSSNSVFASHLSATTVAAGDSITDSIEYQPTKMGADSGKLVFTSNAASSPDTIAVNSQGLDAVLSTQSRNVNVAGAHVDSVMWTLITLTNTGNDTLRFVSDTSTNSVFSSHLSAMLIPPGGSIIDSIKFLPMAMGADSGKLIYISNATTSPDTIAVNGNGVSGAKEAILATDSRNVNCGTTQTDKPLWTLINLSNIGNDTLRVATATSSSSVFSSHLSAMVIPPGGWIVDSIKFLPTVIGADSGKLIFISNAITSPDTIVVHGNGVGDSKEAIFATDSRNVNCGPTKQDNPTWTFITIFNTGNDTLRFTTAISTNTVFTSHLSATLIAPNASIIDSIKFLPTSVGGYKGLLIFGSNAITSPDTIAVTGVGTSGTAVYENTLPGQYTLGEIYPNPVSSAAQLQIKMQDGERLLHAGMYDALGHELQDWTARISSNGSLSVVTGSYPNGIYFVRLQTSVRMQVLPVVITH